ncbi:GIY-YIG nuclease family protein [Metasolibacillus meyeri]|uniref:GIY-YIG nuclease family protein n=2 Tax=Metasolibacillus meyeri TaxID=1071052 RepID=A0AAW9NYL2_9BACL|nr:GIY-YIG nuclease family protein [Metasolibacillus meyeri]MEC1180641.1 GIY-YIG nuclease family protein [Metasolibacillus meyeri]
MENIAKHYFYVLQCGDGSFYAGYTNDLERRVAVHNAGKGAKYTRVRLPVTCIYCEEYVTKREAMQKEYAFKQLTREKKEIYISSAGGATS